MRFSQLQKYIIIQAYSLSGKIKRDKLISFYSSKKISTKKELWNKIITKSIERLIDKELMIGYGLRTPHKWFIKEIQLTAKGRKEAKKLLGQQQKLPLKINIK